MTSQVKGIALLYVLELENGQKFFFAHETDRNQAIMLLDTYDHFHHKKYIIKLK